MAAAYAVVVLPRRLNRVFDYKIPKALKDRIRPGVRVRVSFGRTELTGYVVGLAARPAVPKTKPILAVLDPEPVADAGLLDLTRWVADRYAAPWGLCLKAALPLGPAKAATIRSGGEQGPLPPMSLPEAEPTAIKTLSQAIEAGQHVAYLLEGPRDSRLAVYLNAIALTRAQGHGCLLLLPEVGLLDPLIPHARAIAGDRVAVIHSAMQPRARQVEWERVRAGAADLVLGTRSAVFTPVRALRLIVVDEEHDPSYKAEESPRYLARDVAKRRAETAGAVLVLGATASSVESHHAVRTGQLNRMALPQVGGRAEVVIVDLKTGRGEALMTEPLRTAIAGRLARHERTLLILNRRGYFTVLLCRDCGETLRCPQCSVSVALYKSATLKSALPATLRCHACGHLMAPPQACPTCHGARLTGLGGGTERVEEEVRLAFPKAEVLRLDRGVKAARPGFEKADIMLGTHLVLHRLLARAPDQRPTVTFIGVLLADSGLHLPDFRAGERAFQLLAQLKGLLGPGGTLLIQTYHPDHPAVAAVVNPADRAAQEVGPAEAFYERELHDRRLLGYPPFTRLARLLFTGAIIERLRRAAGRTAARLQAEPGIVVLGPSPAPISRIRGRYRWQLLVKAPPDLDLGARLAAALEGAERGGVTVSVDVDPIQFL